MAIDFSRNALMYERLKETVYTGSSSNGFTCSASCEDELVLVNASAGNTTIYLPPVASMAGKMLVIRKVLGDARTVTVASLGDTITGWTNISLSDGGASAGVVLYSDGQMWWTMSTYSTT